jgi:hypothetical protein
MLKIGEDEPQHRHSRPKQGSQLEEKLETCSNATVAKTFRRLTSKCTEKKRYWSQVKHRKYKTVYTKPINP